MVRTLSIGAVYQYNFDAALKEINKVGGEYIETVHLNDETIIVYKIKKA